MTKRKSTKKNPTEITAKEKRIVESYLYNGGNKTRAYMSENPRVNPGSARTLAKRLFTKVNIKKYLEEREEEINEMKKSQTDTYFRFLHTAATLNITDFFDIKGKRQFSGAYLKEGVTLDKLPVEIQQCIKSIKNTEHGVRIDFYSKTEAITILTRLFGLNKEKEEGGKMVKIIVNGSAKLIK